MARSRCQVRVRHGGDQRVFSALSDQNGTLRSYWTTPALGVSGVVELVSEVRFVNAPSWPAWREAAFRSRCWCHRQAADDTVAVVGQQHVAVARVNAEGDDLASVVKRWKPEMFVPSYLKARPAACRCS